MQRLLNPPSKKKSYDKLKLDFEAREAVRSQGWKVEFLSRTPFEVVVKIIIMWFQDYSRDETARISGASEGTVSAVWALLPSSLEPIRDLSKVLRKLNLLPNDALQGAHLRQLLAEHGVTPEQLPTALEAIKKASTETGYQPEKVIQASIKLADLEKKSGKTYPDALKEFQTLPEQVKELEQEKSQLALDIKEKKEKRRQTLKKAGVTEKEISRVNKLESNISYYGIDLFDPEQLLDYLGNMSETGQDPRTFVSFTKKIGSIERHLSDLDDQKQMKIAALGYANQQIESKKTEVDQLKADHEAFMAQANQERESMRQATAEEDAKLQKMKADVDVATSQLNNLKIDIEQAKHRHQEVTQETERTLGIKNYATEHQGAIAALETKRLLREKEEKAKGSEIAFATVITDFLTTQPDFLFDQFHAEVQRIKQIRENPNSPLKPLLPYLTEAVKSKALEAINGNPRFPIFNNLMNENQRLRTENLQLNQARAPTAFSPKQPSSESDRLCSYLEQVKKMRESNKYQTSPNLAENEEKVRKLALEAFKGLLITKNDYEKLGNEKQTSDDASAREHAKLQTKVDTLESKVGELENGLEVTRKEKQFIESVRANFEGRATTIREIGDWVVKMYGVEIQKRAEEKHNATAALGHGIFDAATDRFADWVKNRTRGNQP